MTSSTLENRLNELSNEANKLRNENIDLSKENFNFRDEIERLNKELLIYQNSSQISVEIENKELNLQNQKLLNDINDLNYQLKLYRDQPSTQSFQVENQKLINENKQLLLEIENLKNQSSSDSTTPKNKKILQEIKQLSKNITSFSNFKKEFENFITNKDKLRFWKFLLWCKLILESFHSYFFWNSCCNIHETKIVCTLSNERFFLYFLEVLFFILTLNTITAIFKNSLLFIIIGCWYGLTGIGYLLSLIIIYIYNFFKIIFTKFKKCFRKCCCNFHCEVFWWVIFFFFISYLLIFHILP
jgi:hypothetical protein